ncbi:MAG: Jag N-terminal domain-containing protein [Candidatus Omnitrophica bacterium]|jgi:spoIIIJ-associated protein|nr:Jag N-terminal domain-containing protein [Candidatus Omnitrophota bacterium]
MTDKMSLEIEGSTVEEAIKKALKDLKLPRDKVKIEVLCEEKKGLFGMSGAKPAKIRVTIIK